MQNIDNSLSVNETKQNNYHYAKEISRKYDD